MSEIRTNLLSDAAGTGPAGLHKQSAAKAFGNLNGTGTIALNPSSLNISSVTDNGVGDYTKSFTSAFSNARYTPAGYCGRDGAAAAYCTHGARLPSDQTVNSLRFIVIRVHTVATDDAVDVCTSFFGDLA